MKGTCNWFTWRETKTTLLHITRVEILFTQELSMRYAFNKAAYTYVGSYMCCH